MRQEPGRNRVGFWYKRRTIYGISGELGEGRRERQSKLKLQITIDGKAYAVDVQVLEEDEVPDSPEHPTRHDGTAGKANAPNYGGTWDAAGKVCYSPVMGIVVKVNVTEGQAVEAREVLLVLEAMKMETNVLAPYAGRVKSVHISQGDSVKLNQILVELGWDKKKAAGIWKLAQQRQISIWFRESSL
jgi:methylmalonyl-CoA carboxyltransferase small subunit